MRCQQLSLRTLCFSMASMLVMASSGCQTFNTELSTLFGDDPPVSTATQSNPDGPRYFVEFREDGRKPILVPMPLSGPTYVQQALEQSGTFKKFRRMKIELYRQLPNGGGHKLNIEFDRDEHRVPPESDYALHPHDRVVVTEDRSTIVDDMLQSLGGPAAAKIISK